MPYAWLPGSDESCSSERDSDDSDDPLRFRCEIRPGVPGPVLGTSSSVAGPSGSVILAQLAGHDAWYPSSDEWGGAGSTPAIPRRTLRAVSPARGAAVGMKQLEDHPMYLPFKYCIVPMNGFTPGATDDVS